MGRLKTFRKYILWIIGFYLFSIVLTYIGINAMYKDIHYIGEIPEGIGIKLSQATSINGRIYGEVMSTDENNLEGKYIKVDIFAQGGEEIGYKYIKIENTKKDEPKKFTVFFHAGDIKYYTINVLDDTEEVRKDYELSKEYKKIFTEPEKKGVVIVSIVIGLASLIILL